MKQTHQRLSGGLVLLITVFLLLVIPNGQVFADSEPPAPVTPPVPVTVPSEPSSNHLEPEAAFGTLALPPMKAVLIVGPIDGDNGSATIAEKNNMELAAKELEANGVTVYRFYTPNNNWDQIKAAANGAHFLMYRGHGVAWGSGPALPVGGFSLKDRAVSGDDIRRDIRLATNAIVMLYGCYTAGSSSSDTASISMAEAKRRIEMYADPFFDVGASGYFADWFGDAFQFYVRALFSGMTQQQAYEAYQDYDSTKINRTTFSANPSYSLWMGWDDWYEPKPLYNNAYIGVPSRRLPELFPAPRGRNVIYVPQIGKK